MTGARIMHTPDQWALRTRTAVSVARGRVNVVANATLTPGGARELAHRLLEAADDAERAAGGSRRAKPDGGSGGGPTPPATS